MKTVDYLIVGGGVAGATAAEVLRQHDHRGKIHILTAEPEQPYERKLLSKPAFFLGQAPFESVYMKPPDWFRRHHITLTIGHAAAKLDVKRKVVTADNGEMFSFRKLLIATGVLACPWEVPGANKKGVLHLRTLDDARHVITAVQAAKKAVVIGAGFIGYEMCHLLSSAGIPTTLIIRESYFWEPMLDRESGQMIEAALKRHGIRIVRQSVVDGVLGKTKVNAVQLNSGRRVATDLVMVGIGTKCPMQWVAGTGIECHRGILTNEYLQTTVPDVWAAGDVAEYKDLVLHETVQMGSWANAHLQGKAAALNMLGRRHPYHRVSFYIAQGFGLQLSFCGDIRVLPGREVIVRGRPNKSGYARIIMMDGRVEGATMINRPQDLEPLKRLIERGTSIRKHLDQLRDPSYDLRKIK